MDKTKVELICGNSKNKLKKLEPNSVDMILTSPPYDNQRDYHGFDFSYETFKCIAKQMYRVLKPGGTLIWVVGDSIQKGVRSDTSIKQLNYFKRIGFRHYFRMHYAKKNPPPRPGAKLTNCLEDMFVLTKGMPKTENTLLEECKYAGTRNFGTPNHYTKSGRKVYERRKKIKPFKKRTNIFWYRVGSQNPYRVNWHPSQFPLQLAYDQIRIWSNEGDLVLDPFNGSGSTGIMARYLGRHYIGIDCSKEYIERTRERFDNTKDCEFFFTNNSACQD